MSITNISNFRGKLYGRLTYGYKTDKIENISNTLLSYNIFKMSFRKVGLIYGF